MAIHLSPPIKIKTRGGPSFSVKSIDLHELGENVSPIAVLDDFRVSGRPFPPHPHAGFSAVTYVFEDSPGDLRSGDSLGNDIRVGPGGVVWTQAGRGVIHHEVPAQPDRELHGAQFFVNLSAKNKLIPPQVLSLDGKDVPEWHSEEGDRVRVVVGNYRDVASPLTPAEPFTLLDAEVRQELTLDLQPEQYGLLYVQSGSARIASDTKALSLVLGQAVTVRGSGSVRVMAEETVRMLFLVGTEIHDPVLANGPFIMNDPAQIADAMKRYQTGGMGRMDQLSRN